MSLFYWPYPSPPISPNSFYGLHQQPTMVSINKTIFTEIQLRLYFCASGTLFGSKNDSWMRKNIFYFASMKIYPLQVPTENGHFMGPTTTHGSVVPNTMYNGTVQPGSHLHHPSPKDHQHHQHQHQHRSSNEKTKHSHKAPSSVEPNSKRIVEVYPT